MEILQISNNFQYELWENSITKGEITRFDTILLFTVIVFFCIAYCILCYFPAPYGKFENSLDGAGLNFKVHGGYGFFFQEQPSFVVPLIMIKYFWEEYLTIRSMLGIFLFEVHYFQRIFIYALFRINNNLSKHSIFTVISAFLYTIINGYLITKYSIFYKMEHQPVIFIFLFTIIIHTNTNVHIIC